MMFFLSLWHAYQISTGSLLFTLAFDEGLEELVEVQAIIRRQGLQQVDLPECCLPSAPKIGRRATGWT